MSGQYLPQRLCRCRGAQGGAAVGVFRGVDHHGAAHDPAIAAARALGHDLAQHRAVDMADYVPQAGDLLLAMEVRQLHRLAADPRLNHLPRTLLGRWTVPVLPHLHDPYGLDDPYMATCLARIEQAVERLVSAFPRARLS